MNKLMTRDIDFIFSSYISYEKRFLDYLKIIPYNDQNKNSWSPEIVSLFLDICGLLDSLARTILKSEGDSNGEIDLVDERGNQYRKKEYDLNVVDFENNLFKPNNFFESRVIIYIYSLFPNCIIIPYANYREKDSGWWNIYNKLKHNRLDNYEKANMENVIKSLASLFLLISKFKNVDFTLALVRLGLIQISTAPEYVHAERTSRNLIWVSTQLFTTPDDHSNLSIDDLNQVSAFGNSKLSKFIGRINSLE